MFASVRDVLDWQFSQMGSGVRTTSSLPLTSGLLRPCWTRARSHRGSETTKSSVIAHGFPLRSYVRSHSTQQSRVFSVFTLQQMQCVSGGNCLSRYIVRK